MWRLSKQESSPHECQCLDFAAQAGLGLSQSNVTCEEQGMLFGKQCDVLYGGLYINVGFIDPAETSNPDVQGGLVTLGLGDLTEARGSCTKG